MQIHYNLPDVSRKSFGGSMELESLTCTEQSVISTHERLRIDVYKAPKFRGKNQLWDRNLRFPVSKS